MQGYIYGGNTGKTYDEMQRAREIAKALMQDVSGTPKNVGEGLNAIGSALLMRAQEKRANKARDQLAAEVPPDSPLYPKLFGLPAYRYGTNFHPGGAAIVGEDGPEVVQLPRGAAVQPNPMTMAANPQMMAAVNPQPMQPQSQIMDAQAVQMADASGQSFADRAKDANLDLNVTQAQRMGQTLRLLQAEATLRELEESQGTRKGQRLLEMLPDGIENLLIDDEYGRFKTARDAFVEAAMRADTGATINESEWPRIMNTLMVKPGDDAARIAERRAMRETIIQGLMAAAGADASKIMPEIGQPVVPAPDLNPAELSDDELLKMLGGGN